MGIFDLPPPRSNGEEILKRIIENYRTAIWPAGARQFVPNPTKHDEAVKKITDMGHTKTDAEKWLKAAEKSPSVKIAKTR